MFESNNSLSESKEAKYLQDIYYGYLSLWISQRNKVGNFSNWKRCKQVINSYINSVNSYMFFLSIQRNTNTWKVSKYGVFPGPYFPVLGLNREIYSVNLHIQTKFRKTRTRKKMRIWTLFMQCTLEV